MDIPDGASGRRSSGVLIAKAMVTLALVTFAVMGASLVFGAWSDDLPGSPLDACTTLDDAPAVTQQEAHRAKDKLSAELMDLPHVRSIGVIQCAHRPAIAVGVTEEMPADDRFAEFSGVPVVWHSPLSVRGA